MASDTCFNSALDALESLVKVSPGDELIYVLLSHKVRFLRTFHLCARKWGNDDASLGVLLVRIQDAASTVAQDLHPFGLIDTYRKSRAFTLPHLIRSSYSCIKSFKEEISQWYIKFSESFCCSHDSDVLVEIIDSLLAIDRINILFFENNSLILLLDALEEKLKFLKNFIRFTTLGGIDDIHLEHLLTHIEVVVVSAAHHIYMCQPEFEAINEEQLCQTHDLHISCSPEMQFTIPALLQRIKPVDPDVCETYIQSLNGSKLSRQSQIRTPEREVHISLLEDFVASLLSCLFEILKDCTIPVFSTKHQLHILYEGLRSLRTILKKQPENFDEKMQDFTRVMVCDAGLVIFPLFRDAIEDGLAKEMDCLLFHVLERIQFIRTKVDGKSPPHGRLPEFNVTKVDELGFVDFLLENLTELTSYERAGSTAIPKNQIQILYEELVFLRSFLSNIVDLRYEVEELRALWNRVVELAYKVEFFTDSFVTGDIPVDSYSPISFDSITQEIGIIKLDAQKFSNKEGLDVKLVKQKVTRGYNDFLHLERSTPIIKDEIVGFSDEATSITNRLLRGAVKLQIIAIVGIPGQGKTTLAKKVYNDISIMSYFHIRAWCCISQVYETKNLLLEILACTFDCKLPDEYGEKSEEDLALVLYQRLKRQRYLIVLDDVWDINAWNSLKASFPDDAMGSRILFTSRVQDVCLKENLNGESHFLRQLTDDESLELLKAKLFPRGDWPLTLRELGTEIVERCRGLPLTIVILAGILATMEQADWKEFVKCCLISSSVPILEQCNDMLQLSYKWLPDKLKPCLLYFGVFPEDQEINVDELTWLWIAEGFVRKTQAKSLEDEAKYYLMDLIIRSLVMVDKRSSAGEIKTCRIHDLLHAFCVEKAKKESFSRLLNGYDELVDFNESHNARRLCINFAMKHLMKLRIYCPHLRSLFFYCHHGLEQISNININCVRYNNEWLSLFYFNPLSFIGISKIVKVLDMGKGGLGCTFAHEIGLSVQLRYLAFGTIYDFIPSPITNLLNLETLIVEGSGGDMRLPCGIWKLKKLRHLKTTKNGLFVFSSEDLCNSAEIFNLETLSTARLICGDQGIILLKKIPNIRKLKIYFCHSGALIWSWKGKNAEVLVLDHLSRLESLKISAKEGFDQLQSADICFPLNLRKLTLKNLCLPWCKISALGNLPNLKVLKLLNEASKGPIWNMEEAGQFPNLIFLKLSGLDIIGWTASESAKDIFPRLEKLVLQHCTFLEEVPSWLGESSSLQIIEVNYVNKSAVDSIKQIEEEQVDMGNEDFKVIIHNHLRRTEEDTEQVSEEDTEQVSEEDTEQDSCCRCFRCFTLLVCVICCFCCRCL